MKITLIGLKSENENIFPELAGALGKKISGVEIAERFGPVAEDLPLIALEAAGESEFVVVYAPIDDDALSDFVKKKLVDVEIRTRTRILKLVDSDFAVGGNDAFEVEEKKIVVVNDIVGRVVDILYNEREFMPKRRQDW